MKTVISQLLPQRVHRDYLLREAEHFSDHKKGIPEWLKNSDDSYLRHEEFNKTDFSNLPILLNFGKEDVMCLDFGGAKAKDMMEHIAHYGSPEASTHGKTMKTKKVSGGHGNGGKYYALSQFKECQIISFYLGKLTILRLSKKGDYVDRQDEEVSPEDVIRLLGLHRWNYFTRDSEGESILRKIRKGELNLFCWRGLEPKDKKQISNKLLLSRSLHSIANHPQSRSALRSRKVSALFEGKVIWPLIKPDQVEPDESFGTREFVLPNELEGHKLNTQMTSILKVTLSKEPLTGEKSSLNILEVDAFGRNIAYYDVPSLLLDKGLSKNLYAYIDVPELKENNCVSNDRVHLIDSKELTNLFLDWCRSKLRDVLEELTNKEKKKEERKHLEELGTFLKDITDEISSLLEEENILKPSFKQEGIEKGIVEVPIEKEGFGGVGKIEHKGGGQRKGGTESKEASSEDKKAKSRLQILVSNHDHDPLNPGKTFDMIERQPVLFQRVEDVDHGIWWVNSQKSYLKKIKIRDPGALPFYFFLIKDIVFSHRMRRRYKEQERFEPDGLEELNLQLIDEIFNRVVSKLGIELSLDQSTAEKIRSILKSKNKFTIADISEELMLDPNTIHAFISNPSNSVLESFKITKEKVEGGRMVNTYIRK